MSLIVNPGSGGIPAEGNGWTNTSKVANKKATEWWSRMRDDQIDVIITDWIAEDDGRFKFTFKHNVTGVEATLRIDGIDDLDAYKADGYIFSPRAYWNDCSSSEPKHEDFLKEGYVAETKIVKAATPTHAPVTTEEVDQKGGEE